jgi:nucleotide-binding universal stress UspA family protein
LKQIEKRGGVVYTIQKILCPTDFSVYSKNALQYAAMLAKRDNAEITLLHVDEFDVSPLGYFHLHDEEIRRYRDLKTRFLKEQMDIFISDTVTDEIRIDRRILPGRAYKVIVEEAEALNYDLIVMARRGTTNLSDHLVGSTAERVVRLARCPVFSMKGVHPPSGELKNILCPTDYSTPANYALSYAISIAKQYGSKLCIHHTSEIGGEPDIESLKKEAPKIKDFTDDPEGIDVDYIFDRDIEPNNSIIRFAEDREVDLIVMSTHGKRGLRRVFIGNNTAEVVRKAECPVLTVTHPIHKVVFSKLATKGREQSIAHE